MTQTILSMSLLALLTGVVGYCVGARQEPVRARAAQVQPARERTELLAAIAEARAGAGQAPRMDEAFWSQMRELIRAEVRAAQPVLTDAPRTAPVAALVEPIADNLAARDAADSLIAGALAAHTWRAQDAAQLRALRAQMTPAQVQDILRTLFPAVNDGQLTVEGPLL